MLNSLAIKISKTSDLALIFAGVILIFLCAQASIPTKLVPITLQTLAVQFIGLTYNRKNALDSVILYIFLGVCGMPVFSAFGCGVTRVLGPTGGYIMGFVPAVMVIAYIKDNYKINSFISLLATSFASIAVVMFFGVMWLSLYVGLKQAILSGFVFFIIPEIIKATAMSFLFSFYVKQK
jgi:biotin transport system substrate-specific component